MKGGQGEVGKRKQTVGEFLIFSHSLVLSPPLINHPRPNRFSFTPGLSHTKRGEERTSDLRNDTTDRLARSSC